MTVILCRLREHSWRTVLHEFMRQRVSQSRQESEWNRAMSDDDMETESNSLFLNIAKRGMNEGNGWTHLSCSWQERIQETGEVHRVVMLHLTLTEASKCVSSTLCNFSWSSVPEHVLFSEKHVINEKRSLPR